MPTQIEEDSLLLTEKPSGVSTHRPSEAHQGFVEWLQNQFDIDLKTCHRLDKGTSGAMVFGKTPEAAQELTELFSQRQVFKEYVFISPKKSKFERWTVVEPKTNGPREIEGHRPMKGDHFVALTKFQRISAAGQFHLYKAWPLTGKTHQVRKHATHSGTPLLGDSKYGGQEFCRLMLHCHKLSFQWRGNEVVHNSPYPLLFESPQHCEDIQWASWIAASERRKILFGSQFSKGEAFRLMHTETGDLRGDWAGDRAVLGWWKATPPTTTEKEKIQKLMSLLQIENWVFQWRPDNQSAEASEVLLNSSQKALVDWTFKEDGINYLGSLERGQNFGLFLDQRERRQWLRDRSQGKKVLNLFAFTCGFSLNAATGGASQVVSVDLFGKYLDWGKENFQLNGLQPDAPLYEWRRMDSFDYLRYAKKKGLQFDFIVCDPPSFSRSKKSKKVFRVDKDYPELIKLCVDCLAPQGTLLFSTNFEKWELAKWIKNLDKALETLGECTLQTSPSQWDYEWQNFAANLKAFFITKA